MFDFKMSWAGLEFLQCNRRIMNWFEPHLQQIKLKNNSSMLFLTFSTGSLYFLKYFYNKI
jgi:hypothetical protein